MKKERKTWINLQTRVQSKVSLFDVKDKRLTKMIIEKNEMNMHRESFKRPLKSESFIELTSMFLTMLNFLELRREKTGNIVMKTCFNGNCSSWQVSLHTRNPPCVSLYRNRRSKLTWVEVSSRVECSAVDCGGKSVTADGLRHVGIEVSIKPADMHRGSGWEFTENGRLIVGETADLSLQPRSVSLITQLYTIPAFT